MIYRCRIHDDCQCNGVATAEAHTCTFCGTLHPLVFVKEGDTLTVRKACPTNRQHRPRGATP